MPSAVSAHYTTTNSAIKVLSEHIAALYNILEAMAKGGLLQHSAVHCRACNETRKPVLSGL